MHELSTDKKMWISLMTMQMLTPITTIKNLLNKITLEQSKVA